MSQSKPTRIGRVESVQGSTISVRLDDGPSLIMLAGESYRIGQVGAFYRIPLGYANIYGICTLVGSPAISDITKEAYEAETGREVRGGRFIQVVLFGEALGNVFERGVTQYPTFNDEVHVVLPRDLRVIYSVLDKDSSVVIGNISVATALEARINLNRLVTRHFAIVGSTGSGKSNLTSTLIDSILKRHLPATRLLVIDPHGEYAGTARTDSHSFRVNPEQGEAALYVPYWALPFSELQELAFGEGISEAKATTLREQIASAKMKTAEKMPGLNLSAITADSPIPFSLKALWFALDCHERQNYKADRTTPVEPLRQGDAEQLLQASYPPPAPGGKEPFAPSGSQTYGIQRQLDFLRSRLLDSRYAFVMNPGADYTTNLDGEVRKDLDTLVASWVAHEDKLTVLDVSEIPNEIIGTMVGIMLRLIYDLLFWAGNLPISGRHQPLLLFLEEAHIFLPKEAESAAHRIFHRIAKEGRKYGVGMGVITQRPTEIDPTVLSQCGTVFALRTTNPDDRRAVAANMTDDLGSLGSMLPSLRTGEGLVVGEAMPVPSRIQFYLSPRKTEGGDPNITACWSRPRPGPEEYGNALLNWRNKQRSKTTTKRRDEV